MAKKTNIQIPVYSTSPEISHRDYLVETENYILRYNEDEKQIKDVKTLFRELRKIVKENERM